MTDSVRSYINRNNLLEVKGDNPTESNPANKNSARSSGSGKSSVSSPSQSFIQFIDKQDSVHEIKEKKNKADVFYGKKPRGKSYDVTEKAPEPIVQKEINEPVQIEHKYSSLGVQTTPQDSFYNKDIRPLALTEEKRKLNIEYKALKNVTRLKMPQHYSDVRTAYRRYGDMLKQSGFSVPLKLYDLTPPPEVKTKFLNDTACFTAKKSTKKNNFSVDAAYSQMMQENKGEKQMDFFTVTIIFPELIHKFEDIGHRFVRVDLWKYWKMYSPYFENYEIIFEFLETIELVKGRGLLKDMQKEINDRYEAISGSNKKEHLIHTPDELKRKIKTLDDEGLYSSILDHLVANFCVSKAMNARILDSLYTFIMFEYERLYNSKIEIDSVYFVDSAPIRSIFEIPASTDILFASKAENIETGYRNTRDNLLNFKKRNYYVTIKELIKEKWLTNNPNEPIEKNLPHTEFKPLDHYITGTEQPRNEHALKRFRKSQIETFMVGSVKSSTLSCFLNPMMPTYKPGFSGKGNKLLRDTRAKKISELPHLHKRKKGHEGQRDAISRASDDTNFIDIDSSSRKHSNHPKSEHLSLTISSKFEELIEKTKNYKQNKNILLRDLNKTFDAYGNPHLIESSTIIEPHTVKIHEMKNSALFTEERSEASSTSSSNTRLEVGEIKRILDEFPKLDRKDVIHLYSIFLTLAELSIRKRMIDRAKGVKEDKSPFKNGRTRNGSFDSNSTNSSYHGRTYKKSNSIDTSLINLKSLVDIDVLTTYTEYFSERPEELNQEIIKASALAGIPDPNGVVSWETFVNIHVLLFIGKGEKRHNVSYLVNFFCPSRDNKTVSKQDFIRRLGEIIAYNKKYNSSPEMIHEVCMNIWNGDLISSGCVENAKNVIKENFRKALECDKIFSEGFLLLINPGLEKEEKKNVNTEED